MGHRSSELRCPSRQTQGPHTGVDVVTGFDPDAQRLESLNRRKVRPFAQKPASLPEAGGETEARKGFFFNFDFFFRSTPPLMFELGRDDPGGGRGGGVARTLVVV